MKKLSFNLLVDGVPYMVKAEPFAFNSEQRYNVSFNGSETYIFAWDEDTLRYAPLGDIVTDLPMALEQEIASRLYEVTPSRE
ncbi:hypothetical protein [Chitinophaga sp. CF418]|uniref:hypothetical protein n=1 Tax=Chitinophaga sp. CF418 TaxID=1855287 RepID=UPI0009173C92|nr:hypothetical protein [Chitinophaga sp. CF418]SHN30544.1 hypothetical protein SAMN05216311_108325 [Chitinophaga sp. CF418]